MAGVDGGFGVSEFGYTGKPHQIWLSFEGAHSDQHLLNLYDFSRALQGFERSLALTTHFVLHDEVITQVTALKGAKIYCSPPVAGSFNIPAYITAFSAATFAIGTLKNDNPIGHLIYSVYDYAVHEATGQPVNYDESLRVTYERAIAEGTTGFVMPKKERLDSLVEKIEPSVKDLHRPITESHSAETALITERNEPDPKIPDLLLNQRTFDGLRKRERDDKITSVPGRISSFNMNTFNGRFVTFADKRPVPFKIAPAGRTEPGMKLIAQSLARNIADPKSDDSVVVFDVRREFSMTGRTTSYSVVKIREYNPLEF